MKSRSFRGLPLAAQGHAGRRSLALALMLLATVGLLAGCSSSDESSKPSTADTPHNVTMTAAQRQHLGLYTVAQSAYHQTVDVNGVVDFDNDQATSVLAPFSGPVSKLLVSVGASVKKGQPLALVESPDFAAAVGTYRSTMAAAANARRVADLDKDLLAHQGVSAREEAQAQSDAIGAEANRDAALQAVLALGVDPASMSAIKRGQMITHADGVIRSPISGTLVDKLITPGQLLQAGTTACFTVADLSKVWVVAHLFGSDIPAVTAGDTATVTSQSDASVFDGKVSNVAAMVDSTTGAVAARVVVANPDGALKKQMYVNVVIHSHKQQQGLLIPVTAVLRDDENLPFVYLAVKDGSFARRPISLGNRIGDKIDITAGLRPGEQIVADGGIFVQFMQTQ